MRTSGFTHAMSASMLAFPVHPMTTAACRQAHRGTRSPNRMTAPGVSQILNTYEHVLLLSLENPWHVYHTLLFQLQGLCHALYFLVISLHHNINGLVVIRCYHLDAELLLPAIGKHIVA